MIDGKLYLVGGTEGAAESDITAAVDIYDPGANSWSTATAAMPDPRSGVGAGVIPCIDVPPAELPGGAPCVDGILYVVGGDVFGVNAAVNTLRAYNPETDTWATKAAMPTARERVGVGVIGGKLYVVGGFTGVCCTPVFVLEVYDPVSNSWDTTKAPLPEGLDGPVAGVIGGKLYAVTGGVPASFSNDTLEYDPTTDTWLSRAPTPTARNRASGGGDRRETLRCRRKYCIWTVGRPGGLHAADGS